MSDKVGWKTKREDIPRIREGQADPGPLAVSLLLIPNYLIVLVALSHSLD